MYIKKKNLKTINTSFLFFLDVMHFFSSLQIWHEYFTCRATKPTFNCHDIHLLLLFNQRCSATFRLDSRRRGPTSCWGPLQESSRFLDFCHQRFCWHFHFRLFQHFLSPRLLGLIHWLDQQGLWLFRQRCPDFLRFLPWFTFLDNISSGNLFLNVKYREEVRQLNVFILTPVCFDFFSPKSLSENCVSHRFFL